MQLTSGAPLPYAQTSVPIVSPAAVPSARSPTTRVAARPAGAAAGEIDPWKCPYCPFVQASRRKPDLRRHVATHTGGSMPPQWLCAGVPLSQAAEKGLDPREMDVYSLDGREMLGGCLKAFSRRDALLRHLRATNGRCVGDPTGIWHEGNKDRDMMGSRDE
ncbi:uncharacterized protein BXZ73DRAFT_53405 [Epithele typhae]|uniref:uncharacterized protein n=1 Tax=Epithele typhae TaxID=378194 RepID=UPI0020084D7A|nr:uncharacterized protein BXZ73DRAFT_53405 [Epithele typhae]KAH9917130.1 hypothetical protein BXZ73DRAFT_53405 [Epithele typhae]